MPARQVGRPAVARALSRPTSRPVGRPPSGLSSGRAPRPILDTAAGNLMVMIALHQDRPCPTDAEIREWTGVPRRRLRAWLLDLVERRILEVDHKGRPPARLRRMRAAGGCWTGWTQRQGRSARQCDK